MGISPKVWGPYYWATIHLACLGAPTALSPETQNSFRSFITGLVKVLPCDACRDHAADTLKKVPLEPAIAGGRDTLFRWSVDFHNAVNRLLKQPEMPYEKALAHWTAVTVGKKEVAPGPVIISSPIDDKTRNRYYLFMFMLLVVGIIIGIYFPIQQRRKR